jgi:hypothetical protein
LLFLKNRGIESFISITNVSTKLVSSYLPTQPPAFESNNLGQVSGSTYSNLILIAVPITVVLFCFILFYFLFCRTKIHITTNSEIEYNICNEEYQEFSQAVYFNNSTRRNSFDSEFDEIRTIHNSSYVLFDSSESKPRRKVQNNTMESLFSSHEEIYFTSPIALLET